MFITHDPHLADVLAGRTKVMPGDGLNLLVAALLTGQVLILLAIGLLAP